MPKFPCGVCIKGMGQNSILCSYSKKWVHQKYTGIKLLKEDHNFKCKRWEGDIVSYEDDEKEIQIGNDSVEVVNTHFVTLVMLLIKVEVVLEQQLLILEVHRKVSMNYYQY